MKKNQGYTLIEMIIVIAIMAILAGFAFVNLGITRRAKCTTSATSFDNQLSALYTQTMALSDNMSGTTNDYKLCMRVYKGQDHDGRTATKLELGYIHATVFVAKPGTDPVWLSDAVDDVDYTPSTGQEHSITLADPDQIIIMFNKADGAVTYGAGDYKIMQNGKVRATIHLDPVTGRHTVK